MMAMAWLTIMGELPAKNMLRHLFFPEFLLKWGQQHGTFELRHKAGSTDYNLRVA